MNNKDDGYFLLEKIQELKGERKRIEDDRYNLNKLESTLCVDINKKEREFFRLFSRKFLGKYVKVIPWNTLTESKLYYFVRSVDPKYDCLDASQICIYPNGNVWLNDKGSIFKNQLDKATIISKKEFDKIMKVAIKKMYSKELVK